MNLKGEPTNAELFARSLCAFALRKESSILSSSPFARPLVLVRFILRFLFRLLLLLLLPLLLLISILFLALSARFLSAQLFIVNSLASLYFLWPLRAHPQTLLNFRDFFLLSQF